MTCVDAVDVGVEKEVCGQTKENFGLPNPASANQWIDARILRHLATDKHHNHSYGEFALLMAFVGCDSTRANT